VIATSSDVEIAAAWIPARQGTAVDPMTTRRPSKAAVIYAERGNARVAATAELFPCAAALQRRRSRSSAAATRSRAVLCRAPGREYQSDSGSLNDARVPCQAD